MFMFFKQLKIEINELYSPLRNNFKDSLYVKNVQVIDAIDKMSYS